MVAETSPRRRGRPARRASVAVAAGRGSTEQATLAPHFGKKFYVKLGSLLAIGFIFHLVYMLSIFDIYFRSPLVQGIESVQPTAVAPAKRVVLFVGTCRVFIVDPV